MAFSKHITQVNDDNLFVDSNFLGMFLVKTSKINFAETSSIQHATFLSSRLQFTFGMSMLFNSRRTKNYFLFFCMVFFSAKAIAGELDSLFDRISQIENDQIELGKVNEQILNPKLKECQRMYPYESQYSTLVNCSERAYNQAAVDATNLTGIKPYTLKKEMESVCKKIFSKVLPNKLGKLDQYAGRKNFNNWKHPVLLCGLGNTEYGDSYKKSGEIILEYLERKGMGHH